MPPENKTAAVRCTIIVLHKTLSIINTTLNTTYYVHFSWKQRQIHNSAACIIGVPGSLFRGGQQFLSA